MRLVPVSTRLMARKFREEAGTRAKKNPIQHRQQQANWRLNETQELLSNHKNLA